MRFVREQVFGALKHVDAGFGFAIDDPKQWRLRENLAGDGALMDVGIYALQACRYLAGEEPIKVATLETKTDPVKFAEVDETIHWLMKFASGKTANCMTTYQFSGMDAFSLAILEGKPFEPSGAEGLRDLLVIEAIYRSIVSGKNDAVAKV